MIFHEKFFQCLAGAIPLFLTPQKICLLRMRLTSDTRIYIHKCSTHTKNENGGGMNIFLLF